MVGVGNLNLNFCKELSSQLPHTVVLPTCLTQEVSFEGLYSPDGLKNENPQWNPGV